MPGAGGFYLKKPWETVCYKHIMCRMLSIWALLAGWFPDIKTGVRARKKLAVVRTTSKI